MKKVIMMFVLIELMFLLIGCTSLNPSFNNELLIYKNEDNTVRLEIPYSVSFGIGRLYIKHDNVIINYVIEYFNAERIMLIYTNPPEIGNNEYNLRVSFEQVSYFKYNYDKMFLKENYSKEDFNDPILKGFDETLTRVYDEDIQPLNYFYNTWQSEDYGIYLYNDDLNNYYYHRVCGEFEQESIMITFENDDFFMISILDSSVKLSGTYTFNDLNIILQPSLNYVNYPDEITLVYEIINIYA